MYSFISEEIGAEWKRLARNLNVDDITIDEICGDKTVNRFKDKCESVFSKLKGKTKVTWELVKEALHEIGRGDIIKKFEENFVNNDPI